MGAPEVDVGQALTDAAAMLAKPLVTPNLAGTSMAGVTEAANRVTRQSQAFHGVTEQATNEIYAARDAEQVAQLDKAAAASALASADAAKESAKAAPYALYDILTKTQEDMTNEIAASHSFLLATRPAADTELKNIKEMQQVGIFDNPLEWAYNQIQLPSKINSYNAVADEINSAQATIDANMTQTNNIAEGRSKSIPAVTALQAKAKSDAALAEAKILNAQLDKHTATLITDLASKDLAADVAAAQTKDSETRIKQAENHAQFQAKVTAIQLEDNHVGRMLKLSELAQNLEDRGGLKETLAKSDVARGLPEGTTTIQVYKGMKKEDQLTILGFATGSYGANLLDSINNIERIPMGQLPENTVKIFKFLRNQKVTAEEAVNKELATESMTAGGVKLSAQDKHMEFMDRVNKKLQEAVTREFQNPNSPILSAASPKEVYDSLPDNSPLAKVLEPLITNGGAITPEVLTQATRLAVGNDPRVAGKLVSDYYSQARRITNKASNILMFNRSAILPTDYTVVIEDPTSLLGKSTALNLANPQQATQFSIYQELKESNTRYGERSDFMTRMANKNEFSRLQRGAKLNGQ